MNDLPPAAWYPDPERQGQQRYWDGSRWTEHRAPIASAWQGDEAAAPVPRERAAKSRRRKSKTPELGQVRVDAGGRRWRGAQVEQTCWGRVDCHQCSRLTSAPRHDYLHALLHRAEPTVTSRRRVGATTTRDRGPPFGGGIPYYQGTGRRSRVVVTPTLRRLVTVGSARCRRACK